ncbi:hypothetical protein C6401_06880 [Arthrobacter woluwensis]|uniref:hypothetical protein n=1 Tax=Arthrobacter woluwensis TaxID=156980 RepID=UPI000D1378C2|nr:hypothetical protein [Arthrobacter woluwensis]PSS44342.1 hypothetical protein C6401_06880 [Arthrobacter woluwensis]
MIPRALKRHVLPLMALLCYFMATPWLAVEKATEFPPFLLAIIAGALLGLWITPRIQSVGRVWVRVVIRAVIVALGVLLLANAKPVYEAVPDGLIGSTVFFLNMTAIPFLTLCATALLTDVLFLPGMMRRKAEK